MNKKRLIALLLVFTLILPTNVFAVGSGGENDSSGASYDKSTGQASITTGTGGVGGTSHAGSGKHAVTLKSRTAFTIQVLDENGLGEEIESNYRVPDDWYSGKNNGTYTHTNTEITEKIISGAIPASLLESVLASGFRVNVYEELEAREPNSAYQWWRLYDATTQSYDILKRLVFLDGESGAETWIARVVLEAASNLGTMRTGYAYYDVPGSAILITDVLAPVPPEAPAILEPISSGTDKVVAPWRFTKYFPQIADDFASSSYTLNIPSDMEGCTGVLSPSGMINFKAMGSLKLSWAWTIAKANESLRKFISRDSNSASAELYGDLLTIKDNSWNNQRLASWLPNPDLTVFGIGKKDIGTGIGVAKTVKTNQFKYQLDTDTSFTYRRGMYRWETDHWTDSKGRSHSRRYKVYYLDSPKSVSATKVPAVYDLSISFLRHVLKDTNAKTFPVTKSTKNGVFQKTVQSAASLLVNPEIFMIFDYADGKTASSFAAGDLVKEIKPLCFHTNTFKADVVSKVNGTSVTASKATTLVQKLGAVGRSVFLKGSTAVMSHDVDGILTSKSFVLDISSPAMKTAWGNTTYDADAINNSYLDSFADKVNGKWDAPITASSKFKINNKEYGGTPQNAKLTQESVSTVTHTLIVRGGTVTTVDGQPVSAASAELQKALAEMRITGSDNIFSDFERNSGAKITEPKYVTLANANRGIDIKVGDGWYNEDTTVLVVKEYITVFKLPDVFAADEVPLTVPGLEAPVDKNSFFSKGYQGYTTVVFKLKANAESYMKADSSQKTDFNVKQINFVVPNAGITDSMW